MDHYLLVIILIVWYCLLQNFSTEPPNVDNTPKAPVAVAFNPLAQHIALWQETHAKGAAPPAGIHGQTKLF